jgi:hypothetical protein
MILFGAALLLAMAPQVMAPGPQQPSRTPTAPGEAAPAVPGQVTTETGGATPGETSPSVRPPRPGPIGQQETPSPGGTQEQGTVLVRSWPELADQTAAQAAAFLTNTLSKGEAP